MHPTAVLICPFIAATTGANTIYSTYDLWIFLQQVNLAEQLTSSDFGVSTSLINQQYWEMSNGIL